MCSGYLLIVEYQADGPRITCNLFLTGSMIIWSQQTMYRQFGKYTPFSIACSSFKLLLAQNIFVAPAETMNLASFANIINIEYK